MIKCSLQPIALPVISVALLFASKAQAAVVFQDFASGDTSGAAIVGSQPIVGGTVWEGNSGGTLTYGQTSGGGSEATPYSMYTDGAARTIYAGFLSTLGTGQELTLSFDGVGFGGNWPNSNGYAGVSLYSGFTSANSSGNANGGAVEQEFIGEPNNANQWGLDGNTTGLQENGNTTVPADATFTYVYDTGAWTFTTTGGVNMSGTGAADQAFNAVRIANNNGADIDLNNLEAQISPVPEPSSLLLVGAGFGLFLGVRRGCRRVAVS